MSFSSTRIQQAAYREAPKLSTVEERYLSRQIVDRIEALDGAYVDFLVADILADGGKQVPSQWVTGDLYRAANEEAEVCLRVTLRVAELHDKMIKVWTPQVLKVCDALLIFYIQEVRGDTAFAKPGGHPKERDVYAHLESYDAAHALMARSFHALYNERNGFMHVQMVEVGGARSVVRLSNRKYRQAKERIVVALREGLRGLGEVRGAYVGRT